MKTLKMPQICILGVPRPNVRTWGGQCSLEKFKRVLNTKPL